MIKIKCSTWLIWLQMHLWQLFCVLFNWLCHVITDCLQQKVLRAPYFYRISIKHNYIGLPKIWGVGHPRPKFWGCLDTHDTRSGCVYVCQQSSAYQYNSLVGKSWLWAWSAYDSQFSRMARDMMSTNGVCSMTVVTNLLVLLITWLIMCWVYLVQT